MSGYENLGTKIAKEFIPILFNLNINRRISGTNNNHI